MLLPGSRTTGAGRCFGEHEETFISRLSDICSRHGAILVIRSHLNASIGARNLANVRYCSMKDFLDTEGVLQHTDVLICDWSSIAFDYLALKRPTIFLEVEPPFKMGSRWALNTVLGR
ncbi:MAG: CDP-glycerol glycerophosphotransferase family protein [Halioglobus sp.]